VRRVLGVDPGSSATGWALLVASGGRSRLEECGVIRPTGPDRATKFADLYRRLLGIVETTEPDCAAVETPFGGRNLRSGLLLAESLGVILAALGASRLAVHSYSPAQVKSAVVGNGQAEKRQVAFMIVRLLQLDAEPARDASDAAAVALTHIHTARCR